MTYRPKIALHSILGNEEHVVLRMLRSCSDYVDYWAVQCNGDDNTLEIVESFFEEAGIPGFAYSIDWKSPGENRDHALQQLLKSDHGCDWILRMDADEMLEIDRDFDWSCLKDMTVDGWNITAISSGTQYERAWLWNANKAWRFFHDIRHERIGILDGAQLSESFRRESLPQGFRHRLANDGVTWQDPKKFLQDALELERQFAHVGENRMSADRIYYIAKSYYDYFNTNTELDFESLSELSRRSNFFLKKCLESASEEMRFYVNFLLANNHEMLGLPEEALWYLDQCERLCPDRNEHLMLKAKIFQKKGLSAEGLETVGQMRLRPNPYPSRTFLIDSDSYCPARLADLERELLALQNG
jgi:hypothetical protein